MKKPFDIRNDPKFKARVKKLEDNQAMKVLRNPQLVVSEDRGFYVAAIGINDSYLIVLEHPFEVLWSKSDAFNVPTKYHEAASIYMMNWLMMQATDKDFVKLRHGAKSIATLAFEAIQAVHGADVWNNNGVEIHVTVQGIQQVLPNPYHR